MLGYHNHWFRRRVAHSGCIQIDNRPYYISRDLAGRQVVCKLDAHRRVFEVLLDNKPVKVLPIRGLYDEVLEFDTYLTLMLKEAAAEHRRLERIRHAQRKRGAPM